jgi:hypothetical protein
MLYDQQRNILYVSSMGTLTDTHFVCLRNSHMVMLFAYRLPGSVR